MNICQTEKCYGNSTDNMKQTSIMSVVSYIPIFFYIIKQKEGILYIYEVTHLI
jgi:hypothetical protein